MGHSLNGGCHCHCCVRRLQPVKSENLGYILSTHTLVFCILAGVVVIIQQYLLDDMLNQSFPEISDYMVHFKKEKDNKSGVLTNFFSSLHNLPPKTRAWSLETSIRAQRDVLLKKLLKD